MKRFSRIFISLFALLITLTIFRPTPVRAEEDVKKYLPRLPRNYVKLHQYHFMKTIYLIIQTVGTRTAIQEQTYEVSRVMTI